MTSLFQDIARLLDYCRQQQWSGWDPYDALNSPLFRLAPFQNRFLRLAFIQLGKRSPLNLRPLLRVPKVQNAKGIALFTSAAIRLTRLGLAEPSLGRALADRLLELRSPGFDPICWGYPFDWQNRHFMLPRQEPNIICSTFGGNALLDAFEHYGDSEFLSAASIVADFILTGLNRTAAGETFCFSYTPRDRGQVHNANLLGAAFLARLWQHTGTEALRQAALQAAKFTTDRQKADGSWSYGEAPNQQWVDGFHTGYNLVALRGLHQAFGVPWLADALGRGFAFYRQHFFGPHGLVKYFHDRAYPLDIHSTAQAIITLVELADLDPQAIPLAQGALEWANQHLRSPQGWYYFQKHRYWTIQVPYMRWSQAWMLLALATLQEALSGPPAPSPAS